ncbi:TetR/AcrR family transcriptional regulator [Kribbella antibiotica]|uniref:TetR/AcrR family transcriptional regulator n=1 Tax=Kribbella antibiotica TaxID=190195 RepID=A0A4R4ZGS2_9ACTN|nr:TetR-like C-terminal domain-containing protein [Kribbella antibiotica]TDD56854.1 TetR/AcrR family transcriptional regulator [Kribbella antibiotica]
MAGRPRNPELEQRLLQATWELLTERGYDALTLAEVAAAAGAHRTDVYRRWSSKAQLVVDSLSEHLPSIVALDTGSLLTDLRLILGAFAESWSSPWIDGVVALSADLQRDPEAELAFRKMAEGRGAALSQALDRAISRGEIAATTDRALIGDLIEGPLMHRRIAGRQSLPPEYLDTLAAVVHQVLTAGSSAKR